MVLKKQDVDSGICEQTEGEAIAGYAWRRGRGLRLPVGRILLFDGHHVGESRIFAGVWVSVRGFPATIFIKNVNSIPPCQAHRLVSPSYLFVSLSS